MDINDEKKEAENAGGGVSDNVKAPSPLTTEIDNQGTGVTMEDYHSNTNDPPVAL